MHSGDVHMEEYLEMGRNTSAQNSLGGRACCIIYGRRLLLQNRPQFYE